MDLHEDIQNKSEVIPIKTKEELTALKEEVKALNRKLHELKEEELAQVTVGNSEKCDGCEYNSNGACRSYRTMGTECPHGFA